MKVPKQEHEMGKSETPEEPKSPETNKNKLSYADFCALFTPGEMTVLLTNPIGIGWLLQLAAAGGASPSDPAVATGLDTLVRHNLLLAARQAQIAAGTPPT